MVKQTTDLSEGTCVNKGWETCGQAEGTEFTTSLYAYRDFYRSSYSDMLR